jgi:hypothetical protein
MRDFVVYTNVMMKLRELYKARKLKGYTFSLEGGGAAEICIEAELPNRHRLIFGDDTEIWYGAAVDENGDEAHNAFLMTDVVGTSKNADLIARAIMACIDTYEEKSAS